MTPLLSRLLIIGLIILMLVGLSGYFLYQKISPYLSMVNNMVTPVVPTSPDQPKLQNIKFGNICAVDDGEKADGKDATPNLSQDLSKAYTMMDSFGVASNDMIIAWGEYVEGLSQEGQLGNVARAIRVIKIPSLAYLTTALWAMGHMYSCSATDESGRTPCIDLNLWPSLQTKTKLDTLTNHYIREIITEKTTTTEESMILEWALWDPGNLIIRSTDTTNGATALITTRDSTWRESYTIESTKMTAHMIENPDCSGTAEIQSREDDGLTIDISMQWSLSGDKTTGTFTSRSSDPVLATSFSW